MIKKAWFIFLCLLLCGPIALALAQAGNEREVVATGVGLTEDEAKKQAYRAAVQNVVGAMVVGETLVQNDDLVEEKILSYSDGYVTKAEQIGATKALEGGLMSVTMNVTVRSDQLKEKLVAENLIIMEADGEKFLTQRDMERENRLAQETTSQEAQQNAAAIVAEAIKELPAALLDATADFSQATTKGDGGGSIVSVVIPVTVSVSQERYAKFISQFKKILKDLGAEYKTLTIQSQVNKAGEASLSTRALNWKENNINAAPDFSYIAINELTDFEGKQSRWTVYYPTKEVLNAFKTHHERVKPVQFSVVIELLDEEGNVIVEQDFALRLGGNDLPSAVMIIGNVGAFIAPSVGGYIYYFDFREFAAKSGKVFSLPLTLSTDELKRVRSIRCGVRNNFK